MELIFFFLHIFDKIVKRIYWIKSFFIFNKTKSVHKIPGKNPQ